VLGLACVIAVASWRCFNRGEVTRAAMTGVAAAAVMGVGVFGLTQPVLQSLKLSPRLAALVRSAPCSNPDVATLGYREPSLVYLVGTDLDMTASGEEAAGFMTGPGCRVALVDRRFEPAFLAALGQSGVKPAPLGRVAGFNINGGRRVDIGGYMARR
jgi:hypothetical protein